MNNKQKKTVTIYVIVSLIVIIFWFVKEITIIGSSTPVYSVDGSTLISGYNNSALSFGLMAIVDVISLIVLGIPTFIIYKLWADKKK